MDGGARLEGKRSYKDGTLGGCRAFNCDGKTGEGVEIWERGGNQNRVGCVRAELPFRYPSGAIIKVSA